MPWMPSICTRELRERKLNREKADPALISGVIFRPAMLITDGLGRHDSYREHKRAVQFR
jgi:hypothetical protein